MIWNPWRRVRDLEGHLARLQRERDALDHALHQSNERYEKVREMNVQLRDTLTLYRNA